jgi:O-antigen ligase
MFSHRYLLLRSFLFILVLYPFLSFFFLRFFGLGLNNTFAFLLLIGFLLHLFLPNRNYQLIIVPKYLWFLLLFSLYLFFSDLFILRNLISFKYLITNRFIPILFFFLIIENSPKIHKSDYRIIISLLLLVIIASVMVILVQSIDPVFFINPDYLSWYEETKGDNTLLRLPSIYSWNGSVAAGFSSISIAAILLSEYFKSKRNIFIILVLLLTAIVVILVKSRWVMVNYLALLIMFLIYKKVRIINFLRISVVVIIVSLLTFFVLKRFNINVDRIVNERILEKQSGGITKGTGSTRILAFKLFFKLFPEKPLFGAGQQITKELDILLASRSSQIHVGYLSLFFYFGIVGGTIYLMFLYFLTKRLYRHALFHQYWGPFFGWLGFLLANLTLVYLYPWDAGLMLCFIFDRHYFLKAQQLKFESTGNPVNVLY